MDAMLEDERIRRQPWPPPISEEHAALRERIAEAYEALLSPEDPNSADLRRRVFENPKLSAQAARILEMMFEERELLEKHDMDWRLYQR